MDGRQMSLEYVGAIEALLGCAATARTEPAHHRTLVVRQGVSILVVFACETFGMVFACWNRALFRSLILMRQHVRLEVLDMSAAGRNGTEAFIRVF